MTDTNIYRDIAARTDGAFMLGVVGPVRTGKSTFIKRFMEQLVIPQIDNTYTKERAKDELPQSGSGRTIMTAEPKFVPENPVTISVGDNTQLAVRLVDCVGYMVDGAAGQFEDGEERMVTTPWFDHEISMTDAAEKGTYKVVTEHSTIGIVVTTDGTICDIPREKYIAPEERVITELKAIGKPFIVLLNSANPQSELAIKTASEISEHYGVRCMTVNCLQIEEAEILEIIRSVLEEFPIKSVGLFLPEWLEALHGDNPLRNEIFELILKSFSSVSKIKDCNESASGLASQDNISSVDILNCDLGHGIVEVNVRLPRELYYKTISEQTGIEIKNDGDLISTLAEMSTIKLDYDKLRSALEAVRTNGYGVVMPDSSQMQLEEPQIVRQGGKYSVKLKASAPAIHMLMTNIEFPASGI
jgi:stage IV sporulation protein A